MITVNSKSNIAIRLTDERWLHITEEHSEMAGYYFDILETIVDPDVIYSGKMDEMIACRKLNAEKYLLVVYKEIDPADGFVITAFITKKIRLEKREILWKR